MKNKMTGIWYKMTKRNVLKSRWSVVQLFLSLFFVPKILAFEVFSEQQLVSNTEGIVYDFNRTSPIGISLSNYWTKLDSKLSPIQGWDLERTTRVGCTELRPDTLFLRSTLLSGMKAEECLAWCHINVPAGPDKEFMLAVYQIFGFCGCLKGSQVQVVQDQPGQWYNHDDDADRCVNQWEVYRYYDYRNTMGPSMYDVTRRFMYSIVKIWLKPDDLRVYMHAVNALEQKPKYGFDTGLSRTVFNEVWDFGNSRMLSISFGPGSPSPSSSGFKPENVKIDFTVLKFNTKRKGQVQKNEFNYPLGIQIQEMMKREQPDLLQYLRPDLISMEGLGTVDILYGTYYTVIPVIHPDSFDGDITHGVIAVDATRATLLKVEIFPVRFVNLNVNSLTHILYGQGKDMMNIRSGDGIEKRMWYDPIDVLKQKNLDGMGMYKLCFGINGTTEDDPITVDCDQKNPDIYKRYNLTDGADTAWNPIPGQNGGGDYSGGSGPPSQAVTGTEASRDFHYYFQSNAIEHHFEMLWVVYKLEPAGKPQVQEIHMSKSELVLWKNNTFEMSDKATEHRLKYSDVLFSSLLQTAPRIIFSLYPPALTKVQFTTSGMRIFVQFSSPTLRGAVPIDDDGDEVPDYYRNEDKLIFSNCAAFLDVFTIALVSSISMCEWTTDSTLMVEMTSQSTIQPGDLLRIKPNTIFNGKLTPGGVYLFSPPSSDFKPVENPDVILKPVVLVSGNTLVDACSRVFLDGGASYDHGFRGTFEWSLNETSPVVDQNHAQIVTNLINLPSLDSSTIQIPGYVLKAGVTYVFSLRVSSFFDYNVYTIKEIPVVVSPHPIPAVRIFGSPHLLVQLNRPLALAAKGNFTSCNPEFTNLAYEWSLCFLGTKDVENDVSCQPPGQIANANIFDDTKLSGINSRNVYARPFTFATLFVKYRFTVMATILDKEGLPTISKNSASITIETVPEDLVASFQGGTYLEPYYGSPIVIDATKSYDPENQGLLNFVFSINPDPSNGFQSQDDFNTLCPSADMTEETFVFSGKSYPHVNSITRATSGGSLSATNFACILKRGVLVIKPMSLIPDTVEYSVQVNVTSAAGNPLDTRISSKTAKMVATSIQVPQVYIQLDTRQSIKPYYIPSDSIRIEAHISNMGIYTVDKYKFDWAVFRFGLNPAYDYDKSVITPGYDVKQFDWVLATEIDLMNPAHLKSVPGTSVCITQPNLMQPGIQYEFRLAVTDPNGLVGRTSMEFILQGVRPSGGNMAVSPEEGEALLTDFTFTLWGWGTEDAPLTYRFGYDLYPTDPFKSEIRYWGTVFSAENVISQKLPLGWIGNNRKVRVYGFIKSSKGAIASEYIDVAVYEPVNGTAPDIIVLDLMEQARLKDPDSAMNDMLLGTAMLLPDTVDTTSPEGFADLEQINQNTVVPVAALNAVLDELESRKNEFVQTIGAKQSQGNVYSQVIQAGLKTDRVLGMVEGWIDEILAEGFFFESGSVDIGGIVGQVLDGLLPGQHEPGLAQQEQTRRLLETGRSLEDIRRIRDEGILYDEDNSHSKDDTYSRNGELEGSDFLMHNGDDHNVEETSLESLQNSKNQQRNTDDYGQQNSQSGSTRELQQESVFELLSPDVFSVYEEDERAREISLMYANGGSPRTNKIYHAYKYFDTKSMIDRIEKLQQAKISNHKKKKRDVHHRDGMFHNIKNHSNKAKARKSVTSSGATIYRDGRQEDDEDESDEHDPSHMVGGSSWKQILQEAGIWNPTSINLHPNGDFIPVIGKNASNFVIDTSQHMTEHSGSVNTSRTSLNGGDNISPLVSEYTSDPDVSELIEAGDVHAADVKRDYHPEKWSAMYNPPREKMTRQRFHSLGGHLDPIEGELSRFKFVNGTRANGNSLGPTVNGDSDSDVLQNILDRVNNAGIISGEAGGVAPTTVSIGSHTAIGIPLRVGMTGENRNSRFSNKMYQFTEENSLENLAAGNGRVLSRTSSSGTIAAREVDRKKSPPKVRMLNEMRRILDQKNRREGQVIYSTDGGKHYLDYEEVLVRSLTHDWSTVVDDPILSTKLAKLQNVDDDRRYQREVLRRYYQGYYYERKKTEEQRRYTNMEEISSSAIRTRLLANANEERKRQRYFGYAANAVQSNTNYDPKNQVFDQDLNQVLDIPTLDDSQDDIQKRIDTWLDHEMKSIGKILELENQQTKKDNSRYLDHHDQGFQDGKVEKLIPSNKDRPYSPRHTHHDHHEDDLHEYFHHQMLPQRALHSKLRALTPKSAAAFPSIDKRSSKMRYDHINKVINIQQKMYKNFVKAMYPGERPEITSNEGHTLAIGVTHSLRVPDNQMDPSASSRFGIPTAHMTSLFEIDGVERKPIFTYLDVEYHKWIYGDVLQTPDGKLLNMDPKITQFPYKTLNHQDFSAGAFMSPGVYRNYTQYMYQLALNNTADPTLFEPGMALLPGKTRQLFESVFGGVLGRLEREQIGMEGLSTTHIFTPSVPPIAMSGQKRIEASYYANDDDGGNTDSYDTPYSSYDSRDEDLNDIDRRRIAKFEKVREIVRRKLEEKYFGFEVSRDKEIVDKINQKAREEKIAKNLVSRKMKGRKGRLSYDGERILNPAHFTPGDGLGPSRHISAHRGLSPIQKSFDEFNMDEADQVVDELLTKEHEALINSLSSRELAQALNSLTAGETDQNYDRRQVPRQAIPYTFGKMWRAAQFFIGDENGTDLSEIINSDLQTDYHNSFIYYPRVLTPDVRLLSTKSLSDLPFICYSLEEGPAALGLLQIDNTSNAANGGAAPFYVANSTGIINHEGSCVSSQLKNIFIAVSEDLLSEHSVQYIEQLSDNQLRNYVGEYKSFIISGVVVISWCIALVVGLQGFRKDEDQKKLNIWIDRIPYTTNFEQILAGHMDVGINKNVIHRPQNLYWILHTNKYVFWNAIFRDHIIFGLMARFPHRKFNRETKVWTILDGWLLILCYCTMLHGAMGWPHDQFLWPVVGMSAAAIAFPWVVFLQVLWLWRPATKIAAGGPGQYFNVVKKILQSEEPQLAEIWKPKEPPPAPKQVRPPPLHQKPISYFDHTLQQHKIKIKAKAGEKGEDRDAILASTWAPGSAQQQLLPIGPPKVPPDRRQPKPPGTPPKDVFDLTKQLVKAEEEANRPKSTNVGQNVVLDVDGKGVLGLPALPRLDRTLPPNFKIPPPPPKSTQNTAKVVPPPSSEPRSPFATGRMVGAKQDPSAIMVGNAIPPPPAASSRRPSVTQQPRGPSSMTLMGQSMLNASLSASKFSSMNASLSAVNAFSQSGLNASELGGTARTSMAQRALLGKPPPPPPPPSSMKLPPGVNATTGHAMPLGLMALQKGAGINAGNVVSGRDNEDVKSPDLFFDITDGGMSKLNMSKAEPYRMTTDTQRTASKDSTVKDQLGTSAEAIQYGSGSDGRDSSQERSGVAPSVKGSAIRPPQRESMGPQPRPSPGFDQQQPMHLMYAPKPTSEAPTAIGSGAGAHYPSNPSNVPGGGLRMAERGPPKQADVRHVPSGGSVASHAVERQPVGSQPMGSRPIDSQPPASINRVAYVLSTDIAKSQSVRPPQPKTADSSSSGASSSGSGDLSAGGMTESSSGSSGSSSPTSGGFREGRHNMDLQSSAGLEQPSSGLLTEVGVGESSPGLLLSGRESIGGDSIEGESRNPEGRVPSDFDDVSTSSTSESDGLMVDDLNGWEMDVGVVGRNFCNVPLPLYQDANDHQEDWTIEDSNFDDSGILIERGGSSSSSSSSSASSSSSSSLRRQDLEANLDRDQSPPMSMADRVRQMLGEGEHRMENQSEGHTDRRTSSVPNHLSGLKPTDQPGYLPLSSSQQRHPRGPQPGELSPASSAGSRASRGSFASQTSCGRRGGRDRRAAVPRPPVENPFERGGWVTPPGAISSREGIARGAAEPELQFLNTNKSIGNRKKSLDHEGRRKSMRVSYIPTLEESLHVGGLQGGRDLQQQGGSSSSSSQPPVMRDTWTVGASGGGVPGQEGKELELPSFAAHFAKERAQMRSKTQRQSVGEEGFNIGDVKYPPAPPPAPAPKKHPPLQPKPPSEEPTGIISRSGKTAGGLGKTTVGFGKTTGQSTLTTGSLGSTIQIVKQHVIDLSEGEPGIAETHSPKGGSKHFHTKLTRGNSQEPAHTARDDWSRSRLSSTERSASTMSATFQPQSDGLDFDKLILGKTFPNPPQRRALSSGPRPPDKHRLEQHQLDQRRLEQHQRVASAGSRVGFAGSVGSSVSTGPAKAKSFTEMYFSERYSKDEQGMKALLASRMGEFGATLKLVKPPNKSESDSNSRSPEKRRRNTINEGFMRAHDSFIRAGSAGGSGTGRADSLNRKERIHTVSYASAGGNRHQSAKTMREGAQHQPYSAEGGMFQGNQLPIIDPMNETGRFSIAGISSVSPDKMSEGAHYASTEFDTIDETRSNRTGLRSNRSHRTDRSSAVRRQINIQPPAKIKAANAGGPKPPKTAPPEAGAPLQQPKAKSVLQRGLSSLTGKKQDGAVDPRKVAKPKDHTYKPAPPSGAPPTGAKMIAAVGAKIKPPMQITNMVKAPGGMVSAADSVLEKTDTDVKKILNPRKTGASTFPKSPPPRSQLQQKVLKLVDGTVAPNVSADAAQFYHLSRKHQFPLVVPKKKTIPVPEAMVRLGRFLVGGIVFVSSTLASMITILHGAGMRTGPIFVVFLGAFLGFVITFFVFDTLKCMLIAAVAIVREDSRRRAFIENQKAERFLTKYRKSIGVMF